MIFGMVLAVSLLFIETKVLEGLGECDGLRAGITLAEEPRQRNILVDECPLGILHILQRRLIVCTIEAGACDVVVFSVATQHIYQISADERLLYSHVEACLMGTCNRAGAPCTVPEGLTVAIKQVVQTAFLWLGPQ